MNDTAASIPGAALTGNSVGLFTAAHFVVLAILAFLVIAGIVWGARLKRRRKLGNRALREHNAMLETREAEADAEAEPATPTATAEPAGEPLADPVPAPAVIDAPVPVADPAHGPVTQLKGLGPKVATRLGELGITQVGQLAALSDDDAHALDTQLGPFAGRLTRDRWIEQARFLATGDKAGFEAVFGRL